MLILAFETSCDDTSIALFKDDELLDMETRTQIKEHLPACWVVPEVAARLHANNIFWALEDVLKRTWIDLSDIDYFACTNEPGLQPSLYVGLTVAKTISKIYKKELILINHIQAHVFANLLWRKPEDLVFPSVVLTVSWWHNEIYLWKSLFDMELVWQTLDDSAWEAFDKVAKMLWVGFPWWPIISRLASEYEWALIWIFPKVLLAKDSLDFSFSWLKSAVKREVDKRIEENMKKWDIFIENNTDDSELLYSKQKRLAEMYLTDDDKRQISYEFQNVVVSILSEKLFFAAKKYDVKSVFLAWWVSANEELKRNISKIAEESSLKFFFPIKPVYSQDNAAMVWILAYHRIKNNLI